MLGLTRLRGGNGRLGQEGLPTSRRGPPASQGLIIPDITILHGAQGREGARGGAEIPTRGGNRGGGRGEAGEANLP